MSALQEYQNYKNALSQAGNWFALLGKPYDGGGGGTGNIPAHGVTVKFDIYHQPYDGATNYNEIPNRDTQEALNKAVYEKLPKLIGIALADMEKKLGELAIKARVEADAILGDTALAKA